MLSAVLHKFLPAPWPECPQKGAKCHCISGLLMECSWCDAWHAGSKRSAVTAHARGLWLPGCAACLPTTLSRRGSPACPPRDSEPGRRGACGHSSCKVGTPLLCACVSAEHELCMSAPALMQSWSLPQMGQAQMVRLDDVCRELGVPLLCARAYGLVGYLRASLPEHTVVESKPDNTIEDLRCDSCMLEQAHRSE